MRIDAPANYRVIFNTTMKQDLGTFTLEYLLVKDKFLSSQELALRLTKKLSFFQGF